MRSDYKIYENEALYFVTFTIIEEIPIFTNERMFSILIDSFKFSREEKGLKLYAYVIMDNHFHAIVAASNLSGIMRDIKRFTAGKIIEQIQTMEVNWLQNQIDFWKKSWKKDSHFQIWQEGFHPQQIINNDMLNQKIYYIHNNLVKRGLVTEPEDWKYSSARNFMGDNSIIKLDEIF